MSLSTFVNVVNFKAVYFVVITFDAIVGNQHFSGAGFMASCLKILYVCGIRDECLFRHYLICLKRISSKGCQLYLNPTSSFFFFLKCVQHTQMKCKILILYYFSTDFLSNMANRVSLLFHSESFGFIHLFDKMLHLSFDQVRFIFSTRFVLLGAMNFTTE